jgi:hypothetical protein
MVDKNYNLKIDDIKDILIKSEYEGDLFKKAKEIYLIIQNTHRNDRKTNFRNKKIKKLYQIRKEYNSNKLYIKNTEITKIIKKDI